MIMLSHDLGADVFVKNGWNLEDGRVFLKDFLDRNDVGKNFKCILGKGTSEVLKHVKFIGIFQS